ncbi:MAG: hypothetical protein JWO31_4235 [Phycisphaerales bacterium]|nr:hypothetical protein [Phycisphaerales bacterium]
MSFHLGRPILAMLGVALVGGAAVAIRRPPARPDLEVWTFAQPHADAYAPLLPDVARQLGGGTGHDPSVAVRVIPNNALNVRLVSLLMADRRGSDLPDVVEVRQDAVGRYLGPPAGEIGFLPLNDLLATTGERTIDTPAAAGATGWAARSSADGKVYAHDGSAWRPAPSRPAGDYWIDRVVRARFAPYTKDGQIFGLPHDVHPTALAYRADLFAKAGVDLETPTPGGDFVAWPDFRDRCLRFQAYWRGRGVADRWALDLFAANADVLAALLLQRGVNLVEPDGRVRLTDPATAGTLAFYAGLVAGPGRVSADSVTGGADAWRRDLEAGVVCGVVAPDWRAADLRAAVPGMAGKWRMTRLPKFDPADAPTTTWGGTMVALPRRARDPARAWRLVEALYLSPTGTEAQLRPPLGILPAVPDAWPASPTVAAGDPLFGGQRVARLYADLAPQIPAQHLTPDSAYAVAALGYVLSQAAADLRAGGTAESPAFRQKFTAWLAARQADVERQIAHSRLTAGGEREAGPAR